MKPIMTIFSFLLLSAATLTAQSSDQNILQETFRIKIAVQENNNYQVVSLVDSQNHSYNASVIDPGDLSSLALTPGAVISGYFRFETFASEGGLGTTRVYKGKGYGRLRIVSVRGGEQGGEPIVGQSVQLGLAIWQKGPHRVTDTRERWGAKSHIVATHPSPRCQPWARE